MEFAILKDSIREKIIALLLAGELKPGERIKELALSRKLEVSRTPLREALISLERTGLVRSEPNVGFTINELSVKEAGELYPLIALLENHAMHHAFPLIQTQIQVLEMTNETLYRKRKLPGEASLADREFHRRLTELCGNETLLQMIAEIRLRISCYEHHYMVKSEQLEISYKQHKDIIKAIQEGNKEAAQRALSVNWDYGMRVLVTELSHKELQKKQDKFLRV